MVRWWAVEVSALILYVRDVKTQVRALSGCGGPNLACSRPAFVPRRFSHYQYDRGITLREAARFQSFPEEFEFVRPRLQVARQIGNALPPLMARAFAVQIRRALGSAVADDALPKSPSSEPVAVLGRAGVSNLRLAFR